MRRRNPWLAGYAAAYLAFLFLPVLLLPLFSLNAASYTGFPITGWTLQWYRDALAHPPLLAAFGNSLRVALAVSVASTALGFLAAYGLARYVRRTPGAVFLLFLTPIVTPAIILGIALLVAFNQMGLRLSLFTTGLAHMMLCTPIAFFINLTRLEGFDRTWEEAAMDLGDTRLRAFLSVTLPAALPGIVSSLLLTFIVSFDEFLLAFFVNGTATTLPLYLWGELRFPINVPRVLALGSLVILFTILMIGLAEFMRRRKP